MDLASNNRQVRKPNAAAPAKGDSGSVQICSSSTTDEAVKGRQTPHSSGIYLAFSYFYISLQSPLVSMHDHVGKLGQPLPTDQSIWCRAVKIKKKAIL